MTDLPISDLKVFNPCLKTVYTPTKVVCPEHGTHPHTISSTIPGYEGYWCMLCALEQLGPSLPTTND